MTDLQRRNFIASATALASMTALPAVASNPVSGNKTLAPIVHMVYFWLKRPESKADRDKLIAGLKGLSDIPQIQALHIGIPAPTAKRAVIDNSFDVSELMLFNSVEDQNAYQVHPLHKEFVDEYAHLWRDVVVHDSMSV